MRHAQAHDTRVRDLPQYALETLHAMPCGCVAAVYQTQTLDTEVVAVEARGPHCLYASHQMGRVLGVSSSQDGRLRRVESTP